MRPGPKKGQKTGPKHSAISVMRKDHLVNAHKNALPFIPAELRALAPLEIVMIASWKAAAEGDWKAAAGFAIPALPYYHKKMPIAVEIDATINHSIHTMDDALLESMILQAKEELKQIEGQVEPDEESEE